MKIEELIEALEEKRETLTKAVSVNELDLSSKDVLAYSQELDELIASYLRIKVKA